MTTRFKALTIAGVTTCLLVAAAHAQTVQEETPEAPSAGLDIPENVVLFGKRDPNLRKATALVNGAVITETDIEQRLALVVLANGGKVGDEERDRLRLQVLRNLIDETLQIQAAASKDIRISREELNENFARVAANFKYTPENFAKASAILSAPDCASEPPAQILESSSSATL